MEGHFDHPQNGDRCREIVTGREGVIVGEIEYLWGCKQLLLSYVDHEGKPDSDWYDVNRLTIIERNALQPIPYSGYEVAQILAAEVPSEPGVLRRVFSGPDKPGPKPA